MHELKIILASTRPGRKGPAVADWIMQQAGQIDGFHAELLDLKEIGLPLLDEPDHPRLQKYRHEHTRRWSSLIDSADAFVFVTCEYNFGMPATLKNALDYLYKEWQGKPAGIVSYGGVSAGTRSAQMLKQVLTALNVMPLAEAVTIPSFTSRIDDSGVFGSDERLDKSAEAMFRELLRWTKALGALR